MLYSLLKFLITVAAIIIVGKILPGIRIKGSTFWTSFWVAVVIAMLNFFVYPAMLILTIPITVLTFGLFLLVLNALIVLMAGWFIPDFEVKNFWSALVFSILVSITTYVLEFFVLPTAGEIHAVILY